VTSGSPPGGEVVVDDLVVASDRPVAEVTGEIMSWLGWQ
jgi:hypothetical protein